MRPNLSRAMRVWLRHLKVYQKLYLSSLTLNFVEPVLYLTAMGFGLGAYVTSIEGVPYLNFIAPGVVAYSAMFAASAECSYGTYVRMTYQKTFDAIMATPVNLPDLVLGEILWGATKATLYGTIIIVVISAMGLVGSPMIALALPVLFIGGFLFASMAVVYAALVPGIDYFNYYFTLVITPMFLFSGVFFPLTGLPDFVRQVAFFMPLYHLVSTMRELAGGAVPLGHIAWLVGAGAVFAPLPFIVMRRRILK
jgi:lipooligosaccharide transport system permease protein